MNKIAILGFGVVGKGTFEIINNNKSNLAVEVKYVFDREFKRPLLGDLLVTDYHRIIDDPEVNIVIECMGGDELPHEIISAALNKGKHVITSNKETVSKHFDEYLSLAKTHDCQFLFEASVGGGIPLIKPLNQITKFDKVICYKGILNGTTNYILTKIFDKGMTFTDALKEAQNLGFAEADPSSDLEGVDLKRKGIILSSMLFNKSINYDDVKNFGIQNLNNDIVSEIKKMNKVLKLIVKGGDWNQLIVLPVLINPDHPLAQIKDEFNGVIVECAKNDRLTFIGKGAGSEPTASAILQDLCTILDGKFIVNRDNVEPLEVKFLDMGDYLTYKDGQCNIVTINKLEDLYSYDFVAKIMK